MTFHRGYFINQEETVYTAQFFAAFKPNWEYSSRTKWNKCPLFYKVQGISPNKLCALKEDLYANWDDHYPSATYPPPKHYKNEKIDTETNRYVLQEHFSHPQLHHVMALVAIFEYLYPLEIKSVWFIKKSRGGDGFPRLHQDLVEVRIAAATIVLNIDSLGHEEEENEKQQQLTTKADATKGSASDDPIVTDVALSPAADTVKEIETVEAMSKGAKGQVKSSYKKSWL